LNVDIGYMDVFAESKCSETGWQITNPIYDISRF
jgi:hypothetical protein